MKLFSGLGIIAAAILSLLCVPAMAADTTVAVYNGLYKKLHDNGDGTHSEVIYTGPQGTSSDPRYVVGTGTLGTPAGGVLTVQGGAAGYPFTIGGLTATSPASSSNPFPISLYSSSGVAAVLGTTNTDTLSINSTANVLYVNAIGRIYNGSTESRAAQIDVVTAAGTGVTAVATAGTAFSNVTTATTTTVKSGAGIFQVLAVNTPAAGTITCYANTAASGTKIGTWTTTTGQPFSLTLNLYFTTGLTCVTSAVMDVTFGYR